MSTREFTESIFRASPRGCTSVMFERFRLTPHRNGTGVTTRRIPRPDAHLFPIVSPSPE